MDVQSIRQLRPELGQYLKRFEHCAGDEVAAHVATYVEGQLSELERKNVERIALFAGIAPRTLQEFLSAYDWDHQAMRDQLLRIVADEHAGPMTIGIIDETSFVKKGDKTPGVQRQHFGAVGKHENCIVTVHLSYACKDFHCLVDGELFLPEGWSKDRARCRAAKIPDELQYRPKSEIALELYHRARSHGVRFEWLTFDEWYGSKPAFLDELAKANQKYIGEVHLRHMLWMKCPNTKTWKFTKNGRGRKTPRLVSGGPRAQTLGECVDNHSRFVKQRWQRWHLKDTQKGPKVIEVKQAIVYPQNSQGLPAKPHYLLVVRDVFASDDVKFFLSNAPVNTSVEELLKVAFSRWRVERCFEDDKSYVGLDHYEGRGYPGLIRHLILSAVSLLFLARQRQSFWGQYPEITISQVRKATSAVIQCCSLSPEATTALLQDTVHSLEYYQKRNRQARESHTLTRVRKLEEIGIQLDKIKRCNWDP